MSGGERGGPATVDDAAAVAHTVRLELVDEPGELLAALEPIAEAGGNLLSVFHERGNLTPRGHIPVEVDFECPPGRFDDIVAALREDGVTVVRADEELYGEGLSVMLTGDVVDTDLSDTLQRIEACDGATVEDVSVSVPRNSASQSSARVRLGARAGECESVLAHVRGVAEAKGLGCIEPLEGSP